MIQQYKNAIKRFDDLILGDIKKYTGVEAWVAGGCVRDYFSVSRISSDVDIYCRNNAEFNKMYWDLFKDKRIFEQIFENENVVKFRRIQDNVVFDLIRVYFENPQQTIDNFDFTICCAAIDSKNVFIHETFFIDLAKKQLMINELPYPWSTLWRLQKYIWKGYKICQEELYKIGVAVAQEEANKSYDQGQQDQQEIENMEYDQNSKRNPRLFLGID